MISSQGMIEQALKLLQEKVDPGHTLDLSRFKRSDVLLMINLEQDAIALEVPGLFDGNDSSLLTVSNQALYTLPNSVGMIREVAVNGVQCLRTTKSAIQGDSIRGDLVDTTEFVQDWASVTGTPTYWYQSEDKSQLGLYPMPAEAGQVISIDGELLVAYMTDSAISFPLDNLNALRKAQQLLLHRTAMTLAGILEKPAPVSFFKMKSDQLLQALITYWLVLRPTAPESTLRFKETEGSPSGILRHTIRP